ncbi:hypothetical protein [Pseudomonas guariconensis]|uniref:hypothetical protein n=1 Tax=Pseudomonas guariconensis TaxID=1288410 RepID=UPI001113A033|nr:hypothetical protein [Pseudomonas guariconensis]
MKTVKWVVIILLIPVIVMAGAFVRNKMIGPVGWARDDVEKTLRARMKDPDSMVIRSSFVVEKKIEGQTEISICGFVDGKNSFGGYAGNMRFASRSVSNEQLGTFDTYTVEIENPRETAQAREVNMLSGFEVVYWNKFCVDEQHPALTVNRE